MSVTASTESKYSWLYNNTHKYDVKIVLTEVDLEPLNESSRNRKPITKELFGHTVVLESCSECFKPTNKEAWRKKRGMLGKPSLVLKMPRELFPIAQEMIKFVYTEQLGEDLTTQGTIEIMSMAEQYKIIGLIDCCVERLSATKLDSWSTDELLRVMEMPARTEPHAGLEALKENITRQLMIDFIDLELAWRDAKLRADFIRLPACVLKRLLVDDELSVMSENVVLVAVVTWLRGPKGTALTEVQRSEVMALVRIAGLTPSFVALLPRHVPEASALLPNGQLLKAAFYMASTLDQREALKCEPYTSWSHPRPLSLAPPTSCLVNITVNELLTAINECVTKKAVSTVQYKPENKIHTDGFFITPAFQVQWPAGAAADTTTVNVWIGAAVDVLVDDKSLLPGTMGFTRPIQLKLECGDYWKVIDEVYDAQHDWGRGYPAFFVVKDYNNPLDSLEEFVEGDSITIKFTAGNSRRL